MTTIITPNITSRKKEHAIFFLSGQIKLRCSQLTSKECVNPELRLGRGGRRVRRGWEGWERIEILVFILLKTGQLWFKRRWFPSFFTRCKSSYLLIDKIRLNLGNQGGLWDIKLTPVNMIFIYIWKCSSKRKSHRGFQSTSSAVLSLIFFTLTRFFYLIKPASSWVANREKVITRSRRFYRQIQNKRGIVSKETEALCRRGVLQNKSGFIDWVHSVNWPT